MFSRLIGALESGVTVYVPSECGQRFLELLLSSGIQAETVLANDDGGIYAELSMKNVEKIASALDKLSIKVYIINIKGWYTLIAKLKSRLGAVIGIAMFVGLVWLSTLFVWRVDVVGAESVPIYELKSQLSELGVSSGSKISEIDAQTVANELLLRSPELSWASLDVTGTTVTLTIRETEVSEEREKRAMLLVAAEDGTVESVLVYSGVAAVKQGSVVKAGDVLISGAVSGGGLQYSDDPVLRLGVASGSVIARVERSCSVMLPLCETLHEANGVKHTRKSVNIFGLRFDIGVPYASENCTESVRQYNVTLFGVIELPIEVTETVWEEQTERKVVRSEQEAVAEARKRAAAKVTEELGNGDLLWLRLTECVRDGVCTVTAEYGCSVEIATVYRSLEYTE